VVNRPIVANDPTGHRCEGGVAECSLEKPVHNVDYWKGMIKSHFGVTLDDGGAVHPYFKTSEGLKWDEKDAQLVYIGLTNEDHLLGGNLRKIIGSATFTLNTHPTSGHYYGRTTYIENQNVIDFYKSSTIPLINLYHEFGHVLDNSTGGAFSAALKDSVHRGDDDTYWFGGDGAGKLNASVLLKNSSVDDPNFGPLSIDDVFQHNDGSPTEQWADIWANYAYDNIDYHKEGGLDLWEWIFTKTVSYSTSP
jgi:hypothetical protein